MCNTTHSFPNYGLLRHSPRGEAWTPRRTCFCSKCPENTVAYFFLFFRNTTDGPARRGRPPTEAENNPHAKRCREVRPCEKFTGCVLEMAPTPRCLVGAKKPAPKMPTCTVTRSCVARPDQRVWGCGSSERLTSSEKTLSVATYPENIFLKMTNPENVF